MSALQDFQQKRPAIFRRMLEVMRTMPAPMPTEHSDQFINGYLAVISSALQGDLGPRDEYLESVIPPLKANQMPLGYIVGSLAGVNAALVAEIDREHFSWYSLFLSAYADKLCQIWENS